MNSKRNYTVVIDAFLWNPRIFLLVMIGLGSIIWAIGQYWSQGQMEWSETNARLTDIQLNERLRDKEKESYLKLTYDYVVEAKIYQAYFEEVLTTEFDAEARSKELERTRDLISIYYNVDNPSETTFDKLETKTDNNLLYVLVPTMIAIVGLGYWLLKITHDLYYKTGS